MAVCVGGVALPGLGGGGVTLQQVARALLAEGEDIESPIFLTLAAEFGWSRTVDAIYEVRED